MALDSYAALKTSIGAWLNKAGLTGIDTIAADLIALAEAQMNRELNVREMTGTSTVTITDEEMALPCDFAGVRSFRIDGTPSASLDYAPPDAFDDTFGGVGRPTRYTITDCIVFDPVPDGEYEARLRYRKRIPALSASNTTNWLLRKHPDAYLYGALTQAQLYFHDDERTQFASLYGKALEAIADDDKRTAYPSTLNAPARSLG
jgi:hypothetical protein